MIKLGVAIATLAAVALAFNEPAGSYEVKDMHLCCGGCNGAATGALNGGGAKDAQASGKSVTFMAANDVAAQKALDKLVAAGFWGTLESKTVKLNDDSGTVLPPKAKPIHVSSATFKGAHNCCDGCNKALKEAIKGVTGVESEDATAKKDSFTVKGNYDPSDLIKAIHAAGYHAKIEKPEIIREKK
ncbi:MAG: heavy-metal-associated domain-containing protein [Planctomycetes bacterium]|nr:heavy-metal-associated domain-containing protein [Planctomycetota bacterium]